MRGTPLERLRDKITLDPMTGCWPWQAGEDGKGYGMLSYHGRSVRAHIVSYLELVGPVPDGLVLDHLCNHPPCVNPAHLKPKTHKENILRGTAPAAVNSRKTHCDEGHELPEPKNGKRVCFVCASAKAAKWNKENPERRKANLARYAEKRKHNQ